MQTGHFVFGKSRALGRRKRGRSKLFHVDDLGVGGSILIENQFPPVNGGSLQLQDDEVMLLIVFIQQFGRAGTGPLVDALGAFQVGPSKDG